MHILSQPPPSTSDKSAWTRWMPFWHGLFYVAVILTTAFALAQRTHEGTEVGLLLCLSLALSLWYGVYILVSPHTLQGRPLLAMIYLGVGWAIWFGMARLDPIFLFMLTGLYPQAYVVLLSPAKFLGALILTALSVWQVVLLTGGIDGSVVLVLISAAAGIIMAAFIRTIVGQSEQRQQLIEELKTTRLALAAAERQAGIIEERHRLAGEIHDTLAQGFTSIVMHLEAAEAVLPDDGGPVYFHLNQARRTARENLAESRRLLWALQPAALNWASLPQALAYLVDRWAEETTVRTLFTTTGKVHPLRPEIEAALVRATQESLANARKYAQATQVVVTLSYMEDTVALDVQDDGIGFDTACLSRLPTGLTGNGFGLKALRERVEQLNGSLAIESSPGAGATIAVSLPALVTEPTPVRVAIPEAQP